jgi:hypothetical protein
MPDIVVRQIEQMAGDYGSPDTFKIYWGPCIPPLSNNKDGFQLVEQTSGAQGNGQQAHEPMDNPAAEHNHMELFLSLMTATSMLAMIHSMMTWINVSILMSSLPSVYTPGAKNEFF